MKVARFGGKLIFDTTGNTDRSSQPISVDRKILLLSYADISATMVVSTEVNGSITNKKEVSDKENLWSSILSDVQTRGNTKLPSCKQILVLGDNESGKTTLVAKLQGVEDPKKGSGLEYAYIDVRDDYRDDHTRLSVWVLDGNPNHTNLLKFALCPATFPHTLIILTVAMTCPWGLLEQLQHWAAVLGDHVDRMGVDRDVRAARRQHVVRAWQEYTEPGDDVDPASPLKRDRKSWECEEGEGGGWEMGEGGGEGMLPEGVLTTNLGLDIVVVVTKTDYMATLEKEQDYRDEQLDFMQQWIRRFCLQHGAALFYTSAKEDKNCDLLYKYLTHRIYALPFRTPALVVEKDAVFIPAGWDNMKKISILYENMHTCKPGDYYRDIIAQPITRKAVSHRENEVLAEDEQSFLARQQQLLLAGGGLTVAGPRSGESPIRAAGIGKPSPRAAGSPGLQGSPKKLDGAKVVGTPGGEGVLANFFNSLLHKKSGASPASPGKPPELAVSAATPDKATAAAVRSDAAAELDRLARAKPAPSPNVTLDLNASDC